MNAKYLSVAKVILLSAVIGFFSLQSSAKSLKPAPDFAVNDKQRLSDLQGKVVYLDFWASWCGPCRKSFPWMNELTEKYNEDEFVVISVNLDAERKAAQKFLAKYPAKFSITYDPEGVIAEQYQVMGMPSSYLINPQGQIAATHIGFRKKKVAKYQQQIEHLLKVKRGKP